MSDDLMTPPEVRAYLRVSARTLRRLGLPCIRLGARTVLYRRSVVDAYLKQHESKAA